MLRQAAAEVAGTANKPFVFRWALPATGTLAVFIAAALWYVKSLEHPDLSGTTEPVGQNLALAAPPVVAENSPLVVSEGPPPFVTESEPLEMQLRNATPDASFANGISTLAALWSITYDSDNGLACPQMKAQGLSCLSQRGTWNVLRQLDRPVMLTLTDSDGNAYRPVLISMDESHAELGFGGSTASFSLSEISDLWFGQYLLIWQPPNGVAAAIKRGMRDENVRWLRQSLATLDGNDQPQTGDADFFDAELEQRLMEFQRAHRLQVDGLAGQQTQIIINSMLALEGIPRLVTSH